MKSRSILLGLAFIDSCLVQCLGSAFEIRIYWTFRKQFKDVVSHLVANFTKLWVPFCRKLLFRTKLIVSSDKKWLQLARWLGNNNESIFIVMQAHTMHSLSIIGSIRITEVHACDIDCQSIVDNGWQRPNSSAWYGQNKCTPSCMKCTTSIGFCNKIMY